MALIMSVPAADFSGGNTSTWPAASHEPGRDLRSRTKTHPVPDPLLGFRVDGVARLCITPEMDGFLMYRADEDDGWVLPRIELVEEWLNQHEHEHAGLTPLQEQLKAYLEEQERPGEADA